METETIDCIVIGAGAVGLAVARELAIGGREVVVLDAAAGIGTGTSSRNSEVVHAGIYYEPKSLKARLCVQGRQALYDYCDARHVPYRRCGKLIVATSTAQQQALLAIQAKALANGVDDLRRISAAEARALEPAIACTAALLSPSTGIFDSHAYMLALQADAENAGALFAFGSPVTGGVIDAAGITLAIGGREPGRWHARTVVNCGGLHAQAIAASLDGMPAAQVPQTFYAKGNYFSLAAPARFDHLVYPVPEPGGLGVHLTLDLGGQVRFGPDVEWIDAIDYRVDGRRADAFYAEVRKYWPDLPDGALQADYAGIRPKLSGPGMPAADFRIDGPAVHGVAGLVNLFGIESPGLTASLAIARMVAGMTA